MTVTLEKPAQNLILTGAVQYIEVAELVERFESGEWGYCEEEFYVRTESTSNEKAYQDALKSFDINTGDEVIQILFPVTLYDSVKNPGKKNLLNGNNRVKNLIILYKAATDKSVFAPVPYNELQVTINEEIALTFQNKANDTTIQHSIADKLRKADEYWKKREAYWKKQPGVTAQAAKGKASEDCRKALRISQPQFSKFSNVANSGTMMLNFIENDMLDVENAYNIMRIHKTQAKEKGNESLQLEFVLTSIEALAKARNSVNSRGLTRIEPQDLATYQDSLKKLKEAEKQAEKEAKEKEKTAHLPNYETLSQLEEAGLITGDAVDDSKQSIDKYEGLTEKDLVTALLVASKGEMIDPSDVTRAVKKLGHGIKEVSLEDLKKNCYDTEEVIKIQNYDVINDSTHANDLSFKAVGNALKLLAKTNRYFKGGDSKADMEAILRITANRLQNLDLAMSEAKPEELAEISGLVELIQDNLINLNKKLEANNKAEKASAKVIELSEEKVELSEADVIANNIRQAMAADDADFEDEEEPQPTTTKVQGDLPF